MNTKQHEIKKDISSRIKNFLIASYFFISFFEVYLNEALGSIIKYYMIAVVLILLFWARQLSFQRFHLILSIWLLYKFISVLWSPDHYIFEQHYLTHLSMFAMLIMITAQKDTAECYRYIRNALWIGSALCGVLSLFLNQPYEGSFNRQSMMLFNIQNDPNNMAVFLAFGLSISLYFLLYGEKYKLLHIAVIGINSYNILLTGSRGGFLSIIAIVIGYVFTLIDRNTHKTNHKRVFILVLVGVITGIVMLRLLPQDISDRLFDFNTYEDGSNRLYMWRHALSLLASPFNLLFGAGWGAYRVNGGYSSLHNTFLSILCDVGILGSLLLWGPILKALRALIKKREILSFAIFISSMAPSFFIEAINKRFFWNAITVVLVAYICLQKESNADMSVKIKSRYLK